MSRHENHNRFCSTMPFFWLCLRRSDRDRVFSKVDRLPVVVEIGSDGMHICGGGRAQMEMGGQNTIVY